MKEIPAETRYARSGDLNIAYQVIGDGPFDLILVPGLASHLDFQWEEEGQERFFNHLASFCRLIRFDKRGCGMSDPVANMPTLEERMDDVRAVMDAVGAEKVALIGLSEGGPLAALFAATYPAKVSKLVLWNSFASLVQRPPDFMNALPPAAIPILLETFRKEWGTGSSSANFVPDSVTDEQFKKWWNRFERMALSPGAAIQSTAMNLEIDVRDVLRSIQCPTMVLHSNGDTLVPFGHGEYLAKSIEGATLVQVQGKDHFAWRHPSVIAEMEKFLTGRIHSPVIDRVLATVLFTDIVGSTEQAIAMGDAGWSRMLQRHHADAKDRIEYYRGRFIDSAGDGILATFDGPGRAIACGKSIIELSKSAGIDVRAGLHTGEIELTKQGIAGAAVHIGSRVASLANAGEVLVTRTVKDLVVGSGIDFSNCGEHKLKGVPDEWQIFAAQI